jgi:putative hydrolase of the HAD superfamily
MAPQASSIATPGDDASRVEAVLLDVLGTLVRLEPPGPLLRAELERRAGVEVEEERATAAFRAEIAFYLDHHMEGADRESLERLRDRCAEVLREALELGDSYAAPVREAMLGSLRFSPFPEVTAALRRLREGGLSLVAVSNWDCSLGRVLEQAGLAPLLDRAVSSAEVGAAKPATALFSAALAAAGCEAARAVHVGDSMENDVEGARAAGIRPVLVSRGGAGPPGSTAEGLRSIRGLDELASLILALP